MTDQHLKPCPFCGLKNGASPYFPPSMYSFSLICDGCGAEGPIKRTETWAIEAWNTRFAESIRIKPLEFEAESEEGEYSEYIARAFGYDYWIRGKGDIWHMEVVFVDNSFYSLKCASKESAINAANAHFAAQVAEWLEVGK